MRKKVVIVIAIMLVSLMVFAGCGNISEGKDYTIPLIDLENKPEGLDPKYDYLFDNRTIVDPDNKTDYLAHPDSILIKDANGELNTIMTMFPEGHGKGNVKVRVSKDKGATYNLPSDVKVPASWAKSQETPTVYRLIFNKDNIPSNDDKLLMVSGNPSWPGDASYKKNGFNASVSSDEGKTWTEFETFYGRDYFGWWESYKVFDAIVAMSSVTRLKDAETHEWKNEWMGLFHDRSWNCYKTILTFDSEGKMQWSYPEKYFNNEDNKYRDIQMRSNMCEVEVIRSEGGEGNELCLITRSNSKKINSLISFSSDEGKTWSKPKETPAALSGERHKAEWVKDGDNWRLFITFRSIERSLDKIAKYAPELKSTGWMSEGWVAWVGDWNDLKEGTEGDYRVKLAHTYLGDENAPVRSANADTGYCGNVVFADGTIVTSSYGRFGEWDSKANRYVNSEKTYILSKTVNLKDLDAVVEYFKSK